MNRQFAGDQTPGFIRPGQVGLQVVELEIGYLAAELQGIGFPQTQWVVVVCGVRQTARHCCPALRSLPVQSSKSEPAVCHLEFRLEFGEWHPVKITVPGNYAAIQLKIAGPIARAGMQVQTAG